ncbi:aromatic ring-hydroxylating dioxygenase subunit alpha [Sphingopyxis sp. YF1]|uniref:aromatic ring-hydroxylating oxygenase subunit alpha n=1 Tax=Sphingopyxis sp. YF1 TaxID=2482763 RepID=UPI001F606878|nr:aromatic ring-hydroxylating dioxygenase subunit alpha [Sphingopyxis sp. YF1]
MAGDCKAGSYDYRKGWLLNEKSVDGSFEAKAPYVDNGTGLVEPQRYFDPAFMRREWSELWTRTWLLAGRVSDIPEPGDFFRFNVGSESFLVVRGTDREIRVMYNVCQHRGARLVASDFGNLKEIRCRYHSWAWTVNGAICDITDRETFRPEVLEGSLDLSKVRHDVWGGFVFLCMDEKAPPLAEFLGVLEPHLAVYRLEDMVTVKDVEVEWPANWKTVVDAFLESYHVHAIHPEILPFYDDYHQQWDLYEHGMSRMLMKFGAVSPRHEDQDSVNDFLAGMLAEVGIDPEGFGKAAGDVREAVQKAKMKLSDRLGPTAGDYALNQMTDDWAYFAFPNVTFNIHPEGALVQRFRPHESDPEKMIYDVTVLIHPIRDPAIQIPAYMGVEEGTDCTGSTRPQRRYLTRGDGGVGPVLEQDGRMIPFVQAGMHSRGFRGARLSEQEQRVRHFHREIDRYLDGEKW